AVPRERPGDRPGAVGEVCGRLEIAERLEIRVPEALQLTATRLEVELRRGCPQRDGQRVEGVRGAAVAPVEEDIATVAKEDLSVVEVIVLDRLGNAGRCELATHRLELRQRREQALLLFHRQPADGLREYRAQLAGEHGQACVGDAQREQLVRYRRGRELKLRVARQRQLPMPP